MVGILHCQMKACVLVCVLLLPHKDEEVLQKEGNALPPAWEAGQR